MQNIFFKLIAKLPIIIILSVPKRTPIFLKNCKLYRSKKYMKLLRKNIIIQWKYIRVMYN